MIGISGKKEFFDAEYEKASREKKEAKGGSAKKNKWQGKTDNVSLYLQSNDVLSLILFDYDTIER